MFPRFTASLRVRALINLIPFQGMRMNVKTIQFYNAAAALDARQRVCLSHVRLLFSPSRCYVGKEGRRKSGRRRRADQLLVRTSLPPRRRRRRQLAASIDNVGFVFDACHMKNEKKLTGG
jgi:hypothetical protein